MADLEKKFSLYNSDGTESLVIEGSTEGIEKISGSSLVDIKAREDISKLSSGSIFISSGVLSDASVGNLSDLQNYIYNRYKEGDRIVVDPHLIQIDDSGALDPTSGILVIEVLYKYDLAIHCAYTFYSHEEGMPTSIWKRVVYTTRNSTDKDFSVSKDNGWKTIENIGGDSSDNGGVTYIAPTTLTEFFDAVCNKDGLYYIKDDFEITDGNESVWVYGILDVFTDGDYINCIFTEVGKQVSINISDKTVVSITSSFNDFLNASALYGGTVNQVLTKNGSTDGDYSWKDFQGYTKNQIDTQLKKYAKTADVPTKTSQLTNDSGYLTGITSSNVTTALGYTPAKTTSFTDVPSYVIEEAERVANNILGVRDANSFVIGCISDIHTPGASSSNANGIIHMGMGMNEINKITQLDLVTILGDIMEVKFDNTYKEGFKFVRQCMDNVIKSVPYIQLQGNHDELSTDTTEEAQQKYFAYIGANNIGVVTDFNNKFRNYGYRDFENNRMRVIYLNTVDVSEGENTSDLYITSTQLKWFVNTALDFSTKTNPDDWHFIVMTHHPLNANGYTQYLLSLLKAYKDKTSGNIAHADGTSIAYDFTNVKQNFVVHIHGHLHNFRTEWFDNVLSITIPNACFYRNNEYGMYEGYEESIKTNFGDTDSEGNQRQFNKTSNSANDTAFNILVIDSRVNNLIHAFNYGAGIDRVIPLDSTKYYNIEYELSNISINNPIHSIKEGNNYTATLIIPDKYVISTIVVTMNGVDITSTVYNNNNINISDVNGNIKIKAIATNTEVSDEDNLVSKLIDSDGSIYNSVGYKNDTYLSSSDGSPSSTSASKGFVTTGFIDKTTELYINGATWDSSTTYCRLMAYDENFAKLSHFVGTDSSSYSVITITDLGNNAYKFSIKESWIPSSTKYIRLCLKGTGENLVIKKVENTPSITGNQIPYSTDVAGAIYNSTGYKNNVRLSGSTGEEKDNDGYALTGFMPFTNGDTWRCKYFTKTNEDSTENYICLYDENKTFISCLSMSGIKPAYNSSTGFQYTFTGTAYENAKYIRICLQATFSNETIITRNEPIGEKTYTNQLNNAIEFTTPVGLENGIKEGYYLTSVEPYYAADTRRFITGLIPFPINVNVGQPPSIYFKGFVLDPDVSHDRIGMFHANKAYKNNAKGNGVTITQLGDKYYRIDFEMKTDTMTVVQYNFGETAYIGFCASITTDEIIITFGEEITD